MQTTSISIHHRSHALLSDAGPGSNNIHPDVVELNGTINALTAQGLEDLRQRFEEVQLGSKKVDQTPQSDWREGFRVLLCRW